MERPEGDGGQSPNVGGVNRRILTLVVALVPIVAFGLLLSAVTVPFVALGPGPTFNTLGEVEGKQVVDIKGTEVHPTSGHLNMTTVSQSDGLTLGQALALWMSGRDQLVPGTWSIRRTSRRTRSTRTTTATSSGPRTAPSTPRWRT